jgi:hypothetical protein
MGKMEKDDFVSLSKKIRTVEKDLTKGLLKWRIKRGGLPPADEETLERSSERIVDEAHNMVKKRGRTVLEELKTAKEEFLKAYRSKDKK